MAEKELDEASSSLFRYRSPAFQQSEVGLLLQLVQKYKYEVLNKRTNNHANHAKQKAWKTITKEFNQQELAAPRSLNVLKTKWLNLKKSARRVSKDVLTDDMMNDTDAKMTAMISAVENGSDEYVIQNDGDNIENEREDNKPWASEEDSDSVSLAIASTTPSESPKKTKASPTGFSPQDCRVLLQCVRQEKKVLFSKASLMQKHHAWKRIAYKYNKRSPQKKTSTELYRKFSNIKAMAKRVQNKGYFRNLKKKKYEKFDDYNKKQKIKSEPMTEDSEDDSEYASDDDKAIGTTNELNQITNGSHLSFSQDPLIPVHSSDSGLGSISDTKDAKRLKAELLNYKMATARLERKRIEDALKADAQDREMRAMQQSLQLRKARLEAAVAESNLPPTHPALKYTMEEKKAQDYVDIKLNMG